MATQTTQVPSSEQFEFLLMKLKASEKRAAEAEARAAKAEAALSTLLAGTNGGVVSPSSVMVGATPRQNVALQQGTSPSAMRPRVSARGGNTARGQTPRPNAQGAAPRNAEDFLRSLKQDQGGSPSGLRPSKSGEHLLSMPGPGSPPHKPLSLASSLGNLHVSPGSIRPPGSARGGNSNSSEFRKLDGAHLSGASAGLNSTGLMYEAHNVFTLADRDRNGTLDMEELAFMRQLVQRVHPDLYPAPLTPAFAAKFTGSCIDTDGSGDVDRGEWLDFVLKAARENGERPMLKLMQLIGKQLADQWTP